MIVSKLNPNNDWTFGQSLENYLRGRDTIAQSVKTRIQSFTNDNWLHLEKHINWLFFLGSYGREKDIEREIYKTVMSVEGVVRVDDIQIHLAQRTATINVNYVDVYQASHRLNIGVSDE